MKKGTYYAKKLKTACAKFRGAAGVKPEAEATDAVNQMILAVLSQETTTRLARRAMKQLADDMVDYNELRVSTPAEVSESISRHVARSIERSKTLLRLLNAVYEREYAISLDSLNSKGVREIKSYLESLSGITPYVSASVLLWSLGGHAIPVNDAALEFLRKQGLVEPSAGAAEVQAFLERHISAADAKGFCLDLEAAASANKKAPASPEKARQSSKKTTMARKKTTMARKKTTTASKKTPAKKSSQPKKTTSPARKKTKKKSKAAKR